MAVKVRATWYPELSLLVTFRQDSRDGGPHSVGRIVGTGAQMDWDVVWCEGCYGA